MDDRKDRELNGRMVQELIFQIVPVMTEYYDIMISLISKISENKENKKGRENIGSSELLLLLEKIGHFLSNHDLMYSNNFSCMTHIR